jgi:hypothetical protein
MINSILLLVACIFFIFCILLVALRIMIGTIKILYQIAPAIVLIVAAITYLYMTEQTNVQTEGKNANHIESIKN